MAQYLVFIFKKGEESFEAAHFSTTPARQMANEDIFPTTHEKVDLDYETLSEYISKLKDVVDEQQGYYDTSVKKLQELKGYIMNCKSSEVYKAIQEDVFDLECTIKEEKETVEEWTNYLNVFQFLLTQLEENPDWTLYYISC